MACHFIIRLDIFILSFPKRPEMAPKSLSLRFVENIVYFTRKYPLRGYFLGVLTHTTAWDQLQGGDETLKCGFKIEYT